ncbi:DUF427 domain-containing protein [Streptomyces clavifer]|uniref:DUF427 domain-containing protein n=1 Tax=Streptomyces clavifer TaxID=68188 RepID=UPI00333186A9
MTSTAGHTITVEPAAVHVRAVHDGQVLAESRRPLVLRETGCPDRYWSRPGAADLVWAYPEPREQVAAIKDHFCFYATDVVTD